MSSSIKQLASQTVIYGATNILSRLLNYLLVPLHTYIFADAAQYGVVGELYAWTSLFIVILTYGMETAFFNFSRDEEVKDRVYTTIVTSLLVTSTLFIVLCTSFSSTIAGWLRYPDHPEYVVWFSIIIGVDALTSIFFARLRHLNKAMRFAAVKITNIVVNVLFNLFFLLLCPYILKNNPDAAFIRTIYNPRNWGRVHLHRQSYCLRRDAADAPSESFPPTLCVRLGTMEENVRLRVPAAYFWVGRHCERDHG